MESSEAAVIYTTCAEDILSSSSSDLLIVEIKRELQQIIAKRVLREKRRGPKQPLILLQVQAKED